MRKFTVMVAAAVALLVANLASAASVTLTFTRQADNNTWQLSMDVGPAGNAASLTGVTQVSFGITSSPTLDFVILATANIDPFSPTGVSSKGISGNQLHVALQGPFSSPTGQIAGNDTHLVLGNLLNGGASLSLANFQNGTVTQDGGTILDQDFSGIAESEVSVTFVPEPGAMLLLGIGIAGLSLVRRKA